MGALWVFAQGYITELEMNTGGDYDGDYAPGAWVSDTGRDFVIVVGGLALVCLVIWYFARNDP